MSSPPRVSEHFLWLSEGWHDHWPVLRRHHLRLTARWVSSYRRIRERTHFEVNE